MERSNTVLYLLIALPVAFLWLGSRDVHVMEGIVADGARHMESTGSYAVPYLHGEIYAYKPPLANWIALASVRVWGAETAWALRFPFALSGVLMGLAVLVWIGRIAGARVGLVAALASLTGALVVRKLHLAEFDMPLAAGVGIAVAAACSNLGTPRPSAARWLLGYAGLALGFLAKGIPALMVFGPGLLLAAVWTGRWRRLLGAGHLAGVALLAAVAGGWIAAAAAAEGAAAFEQPLQEAGEKGFQWTLPAIGYAISKPLVAPALFLPWTLLLPLAARRAWWAALDPAIRDLARSAAAFALAGTAVFTVVPSEQTRYFLPLCVPFGILCGVIAGGAPDGSAVERIVRRATAVLGGLLALAALAMAARPDLATGAARALGVVVGLLALTAVVSVWRGRRGIATGLAAAALCFWLVDTAALERERAAKRSLREVAAAFDAHLPAGAAIWTSPVDKEFRHSSLFYYLRRPVRTVGETARPKPDEFVVLFSDEPADRPGYRLPLAHTIVERRERRGVEFLLVRADE